MDISRIFLSCLFVLTAAGIPGVPAFAAESQFGFVYTTDLLPKGAKEIEQWGTWRHQKVSGTYDLLESRTAFEYGASDDVQVSLYATQDWTQAYHNGPNGVTTPPEQFSNDQPGPNDHYSKSQFIGISGEVIYRLLSPYTDGIGLALYAEPTVGYHFLELENKIILQKNYWDDTLTFAFNFTYAPEFRNLPPDSGGPGYSWQMETDVNYYLGVSYRFMPNWWFGAEFLNEQERNSLDFENMTNNGYYFGPNIHFGGKSYFVTVTVLTQLPWASEHIDTVPGAIVSGYDFDNDFEKYRVRVKAGFYF